MRQRKTSRREHRRKYDRTPFIRRAVLLPLLALALTVYVESCSRGSVVRAVQYAGASPLYFLYNALLILTTLSVSELFKKRRSALFFLTVVWIGLGIAAREVVKARTQPFTSMDILVIKDAITLTTVYYTWPQIIAMYGGIFLAVVLVIWVLTRLPRQRRVHYWRSGSIVAGLVLVCVAIGSTGISEGWFPKYYDNLVSAYNQYGFATCFMFTFGNRGVKAPSEYSEETVTDIVDEVDADATLSPAATISPGRHVFSDADDLAHPNIIVLQLESLFDVNTIIGAKYSTDPTPNFNTLAKNFASGELYVPSVGGGTANVEFEVLTGMNLDFFGVGEYPYNTFLQTDTCETIAYDLLNQNYATTAMHNHTATFYSRNLVYANMGFEHFVSLEYMPYVTYTDVGWCEDIIMADEIMKALRASQGQRDFIMGITVESHGKYDEEYTYTEGDPVILEFPEELNVARFSNYLHLIHECDKFVGKLIKDLENYEEPTIVVLYGDHLPGLDLTDELLTTNNLYASRYVVWNNYGAKLEAPNLQAYRMGANLLKQLGISGGVLTKFHQSAAVDAENDPDFLEKLQVLEYDLTGGNRTGYENGENPYQPTDLMMGTLPISITSVSTQYGRVLVNGQNFTEASVILLDGVSYPTAFINTAQLVAIVPRGTPIGEVTVAQIAPDGTELSRTREFVVG